MHALGMRMQSSLQFFQYGFARITFGGNGTHTEQPYSVLQLTRGCGRNQHRLSKISSANEWAGRESHKRRDEQERTLAQDRPKTTQEFCFKKRPRRLKLKGAFVFAKSSSSILPGADNRKSTRHWMPHRPVARPDLTEIAKVLCLKPPNSYVCTRRGNLQAAAYQTLATNALL